MKLGGAHLSLGLLVNFLAKDGATKIWFLNFWDYKVLKCWCNFNLELKLFHSTQVFLKFWFNYPEQKIWNFLLHLLLIERNCKLFKSFTIFVNNKIDQRSLSFDKKDDEFIF